MNKTQLKDRTLWFDGDSSYPANKISPLVVAGNENIFVDKLTDDIIQYNNLVTSDKRIRVKTENRPFDFDWIIPDEYKNLNVVDYVTDKLLSDLEAGKFNKDELPDRANRVSQELLLYKKHGVEDILRVLIFIINTLHNQGVVWGVGRGSSVSSYVLYLIGVHDVDSVKYGLDITDFLH